MESKESARLKDINTQLKGIEVQLRGQNKILKELVDQIMKIADIFDKQWHGDATATSNGDLFTVTAIDKIVARRINDILEESNKSLLAGNLNLSTEKHILKNRISRLEKEIEELKKQNENIASQYQKLTIENKRLLDANTTLEKASDDRTNLQEDCDKLSGENRRLNARIDCLRLEVNWYRKHYRENLNKVLNTARDDGYESGQTDLWNKLKEVADATPSELLGCFADVSELDDVIEWELENFMDEYKKWQEKKKETEHMQNYLEGFCMGRLCYNCPLHTGEFMCGRDGKWFCDMTGEDLKKHYEKAIACSKPRKTSVETWTCTLEGTINAEIDKDLLKKVCGIDSDD